MYEVQSYDDKNNEFTYDQEKIRKAEDQEMIIDWLKSAYQIIVPVISAILAVVKAFLGVRLLIIILTKTRWRVRRDWQIKLGPMLNPWHLALLELASAGIFIIIPCWVMIFKKKVTRKSILCIVGLCSFLCLIMLPFTSKFGSFWLFGINDFLYLCFLVLDYLLHDKFKVQSLLNNSYSV